MTAASFRGKICPKPKPEEITGGGHASNRCPAAAPLSTSCIRNPNPSAIIAGAFPMPTRVPALDRRVLVLSTAVIAWLPAGCVSRGPSTPPAPPPPFYDRVAQRLAARPDLAGLDQPPSELAQIEWLVGTWDIEAIVTATARTPEQVDHGTSVISKVIGGFWLQLADSYPRGTQDLGFLTYDRVTHRWISVGLDSTGNVVVSTGDAWRDDRLILDAPRVEILGERVALRQIIERHGADQFLLRNLEQLPDGSWRPIDQYGYRRRP
ncbi:MAG TPA: DUF1579 family protein [Opitutus sp.]|nr:DUF1579 family protein [Opitutus sp.]